MYWRWEAISCWCTFRDFGDILSAYYHFHFHHTLETLKDNKDNYAPFDPDAETKSRIQPNPTQLAAMETELIQDFTKLLKRANYFSLSADSLERAFAEKSLI